MTERERWIVYPLLFLALGAALRDKLIKQTFSERIECELLVCDDIVARNKVQANVAVRSPLLEADSVTAGRVNSAAVLQGGQPVLSINPQYLPQLLQRMGLLQTAPPTQRLPQQQEQPSEPEESADSVE